VPATSLSLINCELEWKASARKATDAPCGLSDLRSIDGVTEFHWKQ